MLRSDQYPTVTSDSITNESMPLLLQITDTEVAPEGYITFAHFGEYLDAILTAIDNYQKPIWSKLVKSGETTMERQASVFISKVRDTIEQSKVVVTPKNKKKTLRQPYTDLIKDFCENPELNQATATAATFTQILNWYTALQDEFQKLANDTLKIYSRNDKDLESHLSAIDLDDFAFPHSRFPDILDKHKLIDKDLIFLSDWADTFIKEYDLSLMINRKDLDLKSQDAKNLQLKKYVIEFKCEPKGLTYSYIGLDNEERIDSIKWENLPKNIFKKQTEFLADLNKFGKDILANKDKFKEKLENEILANKDKLLPAILKETNAKGYTRSITPAQNLDRVIKNFIADFRQKNKIDGRIKEIQVQEKKEEEEQAEKDKIEHEKTLREAYAEKARFQAQLEEKMKARAAAQLDNKSQKPIQTKPSLITTVGTFKSTERKRDTSKPVTAASHTHLDNKNKSRLQENTNKTGHAKEFKSDFPEPKAKQGTLSFAEALEEQHSLSIEDVRKAVQNWKAHKKKYFGLGLIRKYFFTSDVSLDTALTLSETDPKRGQFDDHSRYKKAMEYIAKNPKKAFAIELMKILDLKQKEMLKDTPGLDVAVSTHI